MSHSIKTALFILALLLHLPGFVSAYGPEVYTNLGLYGGQVLDVAIDPSNPDKLFAACALGDGLFVSADGGQQWTPVLTENQIKGEDTFKNHNVWDVDISETNSDLVWVAHDKWVEKSSDGGITWRHIRNDTMQSECAGCLPDDGFRECYAVAIHPFDPDIVYVGTGGPMESSANGAIFKTVDGGNTWEKLKNVRDYDGNDLTEFHQPIYDIEIDPFSNNIWVVTRSHDPWSGALYWSNDGGNSWILDTDATALFMDVAVKPHATDQASEVFIATAYGILKNTYGINQVGAKLELLDQRWVIGDWNYTRSIKFLPNNPDKIYAVWHSPISWGGDGIGKVGQSIDGGESWNISESNEIFISMAVHSVDDSVIYAGHLNSGVFKSADSGQNWSITNNGLSAVTVHDIAVDPRDPEHVLAATKAGLFERTPLGNWRQLLKQDTTSVVFDPNNSSIMYSDIEGNFAKTIDGGKNWNFTNIPDYVSYNFISDIAIDPMNTNTIFIAVNYFGFGGAIHKSTDGGNTFEKVLDGFNQHGEAVPMNAVAIDPNNSQRVFAGSGLFASPGIAGELWISENAGASWALTSLQDTIINSVLIDPDDSNIIYAGCGYSGGTQTPVYKSSDGGTSWSGSFAGISDQPWNAVTDLGFSLKNKNIIYASTLLQGVYVSPNEGGSWLNLGTPDAQVYTLGISSLYAGTESGLFQLTGTGVLAGEVYDQHSIAMLDDASVSTDLGVDNRTIDGLYMMVLPAGNYDVYASADNYGLGVADDVTVFGADVTWIDFEMKSVVNQMPIVTKTNPTVTIGSTGSGGYCFIQTIMASSALMDGMHWLRLFVAGMVGVLAILVRWHQALFMVSVAGLFLMGLSSPAHSFTIFEQVGLASAPLPVGSGARAQGMGGAFIAVADDATAASWNPAGLIQVEKPEVSLAGAYVDRREDFSSETSPEINNTGKVSYSDINYASATLPFHWHKNLVVSLNYQRLFDFKRDFQYQRNIMAPGVDLNQQIHYDQDGFVSAIGIAGAIEITPRVSLGATVNVWTDQMGYDNGWTENYNEVAVGSQAGVPVTINTSIQDRYEQFRGINFNLGLLWDTGKWGTFGAVIKTPFTASIQHRFNFYQTTAYGTPINSDNATGPITVEEEVDLDMPISYGIGWSRRFRDTFTLGIDIYRTEWGNYTLTNGQGEEFSPIDGRPKGQSNVDATTHVRIGAEYLFLMPQRQMAIPMRAGLFYDPEPSEGSPNDVFGFALGTGLSFQRCSLDIAYQLRWAKDADSGNLIAGSEADITQQTVMASAILYF